MLEVTKDLPRVAFCHGSPQIYEQDDPASGCKAGEIIARSRDALRELLKDVHVVCNSHQAQREWDFARSSVIWHGFSPVEFPPGRHERNACLTLPEYLLTTTEKGVVAGVVESLPRNCSVEYSAPPNPHEGYQQNTQEWAVAKFQNYTRYLGEFFFYLNPTFDSPMPPARAEAMLTGTVPISLRNHDADMFVRNGVNGFSADSAEEITEQILWLVKREKERREISRQARLTAMDIFNIDRYLAAWSDLMGKLV
jgi:glycosyltransferase involved in cell wall biosynthesis